MRIDIATFISVVASESGREFHLLMNNDIQILYTSWARNYCHIGVYSHEDKNINTYFMEQKDIFESHKIKLVGCMQLPCCQLDSHSSRYVVCNRVKQCTGHYPNQGSAYIRQFSHCRLYIHGQSISIVNAETWLKNAHLQIQALQ